MAGRMVAQTAVAVGEAALNGAFNELGQALTFFIKKRIGSSWGIDGELKKLKKKLSTVQSLIDDAELRQFEEDGVMKWLLELRGVIYDVEDIVDEMKAQHQQLDADERNQVAQNQGRSWIASIKGKAVDTLTNLTFKTEISSKINETLEKLQEIGEDGAALHLKVGMGGSMIETRDRPQTSSLVDETNVFGRQTDKDSIISFLLSNDSKGGENVSIIAIVGMGGLGKTTLAQLACNDLRVKQHFVLNMWVCVSEDFDVVRLTKSIIESATNEKCPDLNLDPLHRRLVDILQSKRFLLVLDDVWDDSFTSWKLLRTPLFKAGLSGSKIIVTTRSEIVARNMGATSTYHLQVLTDNECWAVFKSLTFGNGNGEEGENIGEIREKVIKKCNGLPLAVNVLGGLMRTVDEDRWNDVLEGEIWDIPQGRKYILPVLKLSYLYLPPHLKRCFSYCSLFPKDYNFFKNKLVLLWIGEGFVKAEGSKKLEDIGNQYFDDLLNRSLFQYNKFRFTMHDLIHDLAQDISGNFCLTTEKSNTAVITEDTRHLTMTHENDGKDTLMSLSKAKGLRTFRIGFCFTREWEDVLQNFKYLRVLDLSSVFIEKLPSSIGNLKHLRYLNLCFSSVQRLPDSICHLYNLERLDLDGCRQLIELPDGIGNLINLRFLNLTETSLKRLPDSFCNLFNLQILDLGYIDWSWSYYEMLLTSMPPGIGKLTHLQGLPYYMVRHGSGQGIGELKELRNLEGTLKISCLENVRSVEEAREATLHNKQNIETLNLQWTWPVPSVLRDETIETQVLEVLQPSHAKLKNLTIENYCGLMLPTWMGNLLFSKLVWVELIYCRKCNSLTSLAQLASLKCLTIIGMDGLRKLQGDINGTHAFQSLEYLSMKNMPNLEEWCEGEGGEFPQLYELYIDNCPNLREISINPPLLRELRVSCCKKLTALPVLPSLTELHVGNCNERIVLNSLPYQTSLLILKISEFQGIIYLPDGLLQHITGLTSLEINECANLKSLPNEIYDLTSLQSLTICKCPEIRCFAGQLATLQSLQSLNVDECNIFFELISLPSTLSSFKISRFHRKNLPEGLVKPLIALKVLEIEHCNELTSLPELLPTTLESVKISYCWNLRSLPFGLHNLTSLKTLSLSDCPQLGSLPEEGLPDSLYHFEIYGCPTLQKRCNDKGSKEHHMLANVSEKWLW